MGTIRQSDLSISHGMKVGMVNYWFGYDRQDSKGWYLSHDFDPQLTQVVYHPATGKPRTVNEVIEDGGVRDNSDFHMDSLWGKADIEPSSGSEYYLNMNYTSANYGGPASLYRTRSSLPRDNSSGSLENTHVQQRGRRPFRPAEGERLGDPQGKALLPLS